MSRTPYRLDPVQASTQTASRIRISPPFIKD